MRLTTSLLTLLMAVLTADLASAAAEHSAVGASGYDLVSYQNAKRPVRGNGHYLAENRGVTYLFSSSANQKLFEANPAKYLPAYGGYCAFGVSVGKKFVGDPEVWRIVDGQLYLNLDASIQDQWLKDVPGKISKANANWSRIEHQHPSAL